MRLPDGVRRRLADFLRSRGIPVVSVTDTDPPVIVYPPGVGPASLDRVAGLLLEFGEIEWTAARSAC